VQLDVRPYQVHGHRVKMAAKGAIGSIHGPIIMHRVRRIVPYYYGLLLYDNIDLFNFAPYPLNSSILYRAPYIPFLLY